MVRKHGQGNCSRVSLEPGWPTPWEVTMPFKALGLHKESEVRSRTTNGVRRRAVFEPVRLDLMGRNGVFQVVEIDDDVPNLLGQIPLEYLDFVVDPRGQKLIPNPAHGDKQMSEEYGLT